MQQLESFPLFEQKDHRFIMLGWEEKEDGMAVQTNQYVITSGREIVLLDPGGAHVFPRVLANVAELVDSNFSITASFAKSNIYIRLL